MTCFYILNATGLPTAKAQWGKFSVNKSVECLLEYLVAYTQGMMEIIPNWGTSMHERVM